jgi:hypothetical protein
MSGGNKTCSCNFLGRTDSDVVHLSLLGEPQGRSSGCFAPLI